MANFRPPFFNLILNNDVVILFLFLLSDLRMMGMKNMKMETFI